jgi:hypothetical protein
VNRREQIKVFVGKPILKESFSAALNVKASKRRNVDRQEKHPVPGKIALLQASVSDAKPTKESCLTL